MSITTKKAGEVARANPRRQIAIIEQTLLSSCEIIISVTLLIHLFNWLLHFHLVIYLLFKVR